MKKILFPAFLVLISITLPAQTQAYIKVSEHGAIDHIERIVSGGYITTGYDSAFKAQVIRWDDQFNAVWKYKFTDANITGYPQSVVEANDGSFYYMTASRENTGSTLIVKFSSNGSILWQKKYYLAPGNMNSIALSKASGADNGFLFGGGQCTLSNYIIKCSSNGNMEWQNQYYYPLASGVITCWSIIPDGNNYIVSSGYNVNSLLTIKLDASGNVLAHSAYTYDGMQILPTRIVRLNSTGGYAVLGNYNNSNNNKTEFVAFYNSAFNMLSFNELTVTYKQFILWNIAAVNNGDNIVVNGSIMDDNDKFYAALINLSGSGSVSWKKMAEGNSSLSNKNVEFRGVVQNGTSTVNTGYGYNEGCVVAVIDANGNGLCNEVTFDLTNVHRTLSLQSQTITVIPAIPLMASVNYSGTTGVSSTKEVICGSIGSVEDVPGKNPINIYPNPAYDVIHISGCEHQLIKVDVYNLTGEQVSAFRSADSEHEIHVDNLKPGFYMVRIIMDDSYGENSVVPLLKF